MRKFSLLLGALGGAMAGYVFSNADLRTELAKAKDAEAAGKILAKHLQKDGKEIGSQMKKFVESDDVQHNLGKAKKYAQKHMTTANKQMQSLMKKATGFGQKKATKVVQKAKSAAKKGMKKAA